jgi:hypothetical protein
MSNSSSSSGGGGVGFVGLLTIAFVVLKLCGVIRWSWLWVLSPIWISATVLASIFAVVGGLFLVMSLLDLAKKAHR